LRILDTRNGIGTGGALSPLGAGQTIDLQVAGVGTIPADAVGVVLNLTPGIDAPNMVTALLGDGKLSLYNNAGSTHSVHP
jgi:hypothetical protein